MSERHLHSVSQISGMLAERIESLAAELFPAGRRVGAEWCVGSLAGEAGRSLSIRLREPKRGVWKDFSGGEAGDALDLVAAARFGGNLTEALRWARGWMGLTNGPLPEGRAPVVVPRAADPERDEEGYRQKARALFLGGRPLLGSPAETYLAGRGLVLERPPGALRFRPDVWCSERRENTPAMVASVVRAGKIVACHRTFLAPGPAGRWTKAPIRSAKKVLGPMRGGFIPLHRGVSMRPMAEAPADDTLAVAEGIEDALTIALHMPEWRVVAGVSLSNITSIELPERFADVVMVFDRDGDNPEARRGRERAVERLMREGRSVREITPPEGFKDFNAWHQAEMAGAGDVRRGA